MIKINKIQATLLILFISFIMFSFTNKKEDNYVNFSTVVSLDIPDNVKAILDNKCMGCHNDEAKSGKSKMKLNFDKLTNGEYSTGKTISKLDKITKVLTKGKMPPEKFLNKYPDKKLTEEEHQIVSDWASHTSSMMKGE